MTSKVTQKCMTVLLCAGIVLLLSILTLVWVQFSQGAFKKNKTYNSPANATTATTERQYVSTKARIRDKIQTSHLEDVNSDVVFVKPMKISPLPLHEHDIIFDQLNNNYGKPVLRHHSGHFRHKSAEVWDPHPHYELDAFGRKFYLELSYDGDFIGPNLYITHVWENYTQRIPHNPKTTGCFYSGNIRGDPNSYVTVSLCHGMTGYIKASDSNYYIEPVEKFTNDTFGSVLHRIKKLSYYGDRSNEVTTGDIEHCGTSDSESSNVVEDALVVEENLKQHVVAKRSIRYDYINNEIKDSDTLSRTTRDVDFMISDESPDRRNHEYFIKVLVVADKSMLNYHKTSEDLTHYILTITSQASRLYKDATIGNPISLSVVQILLLKKREFVSAHSQVLLRSFCEWQEHYVALRNHDVALLLTRHDICKDSSSETCDTLGVAEIGSMCSPSSSCAIVRDKGLSTSYTIAHEIGHTLSMPHDDDRKCQSFYAGPIENNIMSKMIKNDTKAWLWSACSKHYLTEFLESERASCLLQPPSQDYITAKFATMRLPGELFDVDTQCELEFGRGSKVCSYMPECGSLWCTTEVGEQEGCKTQHMPWAEGTPCGYRRWCHHRKCIALDREQLTPVPGGWGPWTAWGVCSRSCGGGVKMSQRSCNSPVPENGGKYCTGKGVRYISCNPEPCEKDAIDFRAMQCAEFNGVNKNLPNLTSDVEWVPKYGLDYSGTQCTLYCRPKNSNAYYVLNDKVIDGTKCGLNSFDICVNGICRPGGCDNKLESKITLDECGVCGGDNSQCEEISGSYNRSAYGYNPVVRIPRGSSNLDIRQRGFHPSKVDENYLALVDGETGKYILNGNNVVTTQEKDVIFGTTIVKYSGSYALVEQIITPKNVKLTKDLVLESLSVGEELHPPDITYKYIVSKVKSSKYGWKVYQKHWSKCSSICKGKQFIRPVCVELATTAQVVDSSCSNQDMRSFYQSRDCNTHCELMWNIYSRGECSANCGSGLRSVYYNCIKFENPKEKLDYSIPIRTPVNDKHCINLPDPQSLETCVGPCDSINWLYGTWSECSQTCGGGTQTRSAICADKNENTIEDAHCSTLEKITERTCKNNRCPIWVSSEWSSCSVSCGNGFKTRSVYCHIDNRIYRNDFCNTNTKPDESSKCSEKACVGWFTDPWSKCSKSCGNGIQVREVHCKTIDDNQFMNDYCCKDMLQPNHTKICEEQDCEKISSYINRFEYSNDIADNSVNMEYERSIYKWIAGTWSQCSKSCARGISSRIVVCRNDLGNENDSFCDHQKKPINITECNTFSCPKWKEEAWSECDEYCEKRRLVRCQNATGAFIEKKACNAITRPDSMKKCKISQCTMNINAIPTDYFGSNENQTGRYQWKVGMWKPCSNSCGKGTRVRHVYCEDTLNDFSLVDQYCTNLRKPKSTKPCERFNCDYTWIENNWSSCSTSCGRGFRIRNVTCHRVLGKGIIDPNPISLNRNIRMIHQGYCDLYHKPSTRSPCKESNCGDLYVWKPGPWRACPQLCGPKRRQVRPLYCVNSQSGAKVPKKLCPKSLRPVRKRLCNHFKCIPKSCIDVKQKLKTKENKDYLLLINGKAVLVYCYKMDTKEPEEYISLSSEENYSEFYDKRLINLDSCPHSGKRNDSCQCIDVGPERSGLTKFWKVRLNITSLKIINDDYTFSNQARGARVPYGTAGDCYSRITRCGQGRFSIDLAKTSFKLSPNVTWANIGMFATSQLNFHERSVSGTCGGYCGNCAPDPSTGLQVEIT